MHFKRLENINFKNNSILFFDLPTNQSENYLLELSLQKLKEIIDFLLLKNITIFCIPIHNQTFSHPDDFSETYFLSIAESLKKSYNTEIINEEASLKKTWSPDTVYLIYPSLVNLQLLYFLNFEGYIVDSYKFFLYSPQDSLFSKLEKSKLILSSRLYETIQILQQISTNKMKPKTCIMGGNQVQESIEFLSHSVKYFQRLLLGGNLGITALKANAIQIGNSPYSSEYLSSIFQMMNKAEFEECEVELPRDHIVTEKISNSAKFKTSSKEISSYLIAVDIGSKTIQTFEEKIKDSQIILMHGPLGIIELEKAQNGTLQILKLLYKLQKPTIVSGNTLCNFAVKHKINSNFIPDFEFIRQFLIPNSKMNKNFFLDSYS